MSRIVCINCGSSVVFSAEKNKCPDCNCKMYGYNIHTLPKEFKKQLSEDSKSANNLNLENKEVENIECGWLVNHTEGKRDAVFSLKEGVNYLGREHKDLKPDIQVKDDTYVSRGHAHIIVERNGNQLSYTLFDNSNNQTSKASLNGTYINGNKLRLSSKEKSILKDGDTIQIGETKFVLKTPDNVKGNQEARTVVQQMDYQKTIIIQ